MKKDFLQRLLALHYVYPKPLKKLNLLIQDDLHLERLHDRPAQQLAYQLSISQTSAYQLKTAYINALQLPLQNTYEKHQITPISYLHPLYPRSLLELIDPPAILYAKGKISLFENPDRIAVIGSRKATTYSQHAMDLIIPPLVKNGFIVVSGLAKGADAMAHKIAIELGGSTIAVTGSGFLNPYPKENMELHNIIEEKHLLITEYPPYMKPKKWNFPMRNRIISGLSRGIIVTEAETKSGTLSTIDHAIEHGKDIFAVPGNILSPLSQGPHKLIAEGAKPVWNGWQVLEEYQEMAAEK